MEDSDITNLVRTMDFTEALSQDRSGMEEEHSMQDSIPARSTIRRGNLMQPNVARLPRGSEDGRSFASHTRSQTSELEGSQGALTFVTSKSQTGDPYSGLEDLLDIFGQPPVETLRYPKIEGQKMGLQAEDEYKLSVVVC